MYNSDSSVYMEHFTAGGGASFNYFMYWQAFKYPDGVPPIDGVCGSPALSLDG